MNTIDIRQGEETAVPRRRAAVFFEPEARRKRDILLVPVGAVLGFLLWLRMRWR